MGSQTRTSANLSLDDALLKEAKALKINLSRAAEDGVRRAVAKARVAEWLVENAAALESSNRYVEAYGLPLERDRPF